MAKNPYEKGTIFYEIHELQKFKGTLHKEEHDDMTIEVVKHKGRKKRKLGEYNLIVKHGKETLKRVDLKERFSKNDFAVHRDGDKLTLKYAVERGSIYLGYSDDFMYEDFGENFVVEYDLKSGASLSEKRFTTTSIKNSREVESRKYFEELTGVKRDVLSRDEVIKPLSKKQEAVVKPLSKKQEAVVKPLSKKQEAVVENEMDQGRTR